MIANLIRWSIVNRFLVLVASVIVLVVVPLRFNPRSKTLWAGIEFLVARSAPEYRSPVRRDPRAKELE